MREFTKDERQTIAGEFRAAKRIFNLYGERFICHALSGNCLARTVVRERLNGFLTLENWLRDAGIKSSEIRPSRMRAYRRRWLDELVKEFSE